MADDLTRGAHGGGAPVPLERERERTVELLSQHFAVDNISLEELERRMEGVYRATSVQGLRDLTRDLPGPEAMDERKAAAPAVPDLYVPAHDRVVSVMSSTRRRGLWRPPRQLDVWSVMAETEIDLTEAQLGEGVTELEVRALMSQLKIIVPPNVRVVFQPRSIMAETEDDTGAQPAVGSGAPVVRITGWAFWAEVRVVMRMREYSTLERERIERSGRPDSR